MVEETLSPTQRRVGYGLLAALCAGFAWAACPGLPVRLRPLPAVDPVEVEAVPLDDQSAPSVLVARGAAGMPVAAARSCVACHHQGGAGGGGENRPGVLAVARSAKVESRGLVRSPVLRPTALGGRARAPFGARPTLVPVALRRAEPLEARRDGADALVSTPAFFGLGLIDRLADADILDLARRNPASIPGDEPAAAVPGRPHLLPDGRVGRFGWKAEYATLEEFLAAGCGRPALPSGRVHPAFHPDRQHELVKFVESLARPESLLPDSVGEAEAAHRGEPHFVAIGCAACHTPNLGGVAQVYGDFRLHRLGERAADAAAPPAPGDPPLADEWRTPPLWGVADSAPYLHDGSAPTLEAAIARHRGDAEKVTRAYDRLGEGERGDLLAFLRTLKAPAAGPDARRPAVADMAVNAVTTDTPDAIGPPPPPMPMAPRVLQN